MNKLDKKFDSKFGNIENSINAKLDSIQNSINSKRIRTNISQLQELDSTFISSKETQDTIKE